MSATCVAAGYYGIAQSGACALHRTRMGVLVHDSVIQPRTALRFRPRSATLAVTSRSRSSHARPLSFSACTATPCCHFLCSHAQHAPSLVRCRCSASTVLTGRSECQAG